MKELMILLSGRSDDVIRALSDGRKTQLRKLVTGNPDGCVCPYGVRGDRLWVRENWAPYYLTWNGVHRLVNKKEANAARYEAEPGHVVAYPNRAGTVLSWRVDVTEPHDGAWHRAMYMPRWASRFALDVTEVRVQRLQDITDDEARAEGYTDKMHFALRSGFDWSANPWVWVISFKKVG